MVSVHVTIKETQKQKIAQVIREVVEEWDKFYASLKSSN